MESFPFTLTIYHALMEQQIRIRTTDITEITRLYQKDFRKSIWVTLAIKLEIPFQVSAVGKLKTPEVVIADSTFRELRRISRMGYSHRIQITVSMIVGIMLFFLFAITAAPPSMMLL